MGALGGSSMIRLIDRAQRPHCALQPRHRKRSPVVRGGALVAIAVRTSWSLRTLQEQMIIETLKVIGRRGLGGAVALVSQCATSAASVAPGRPPTG
jgi:hypothetical protein